MSASAPQIAARPRDHPRHGPAAPPAVPGGAARHGFPVAAELLDLEAGHVHDEAEVLVEVEHHEPRQPGARRDQPVPGPGPRCLRAFQGAVDGIDRKSVV